MRRRAPVPGGLVLRGECGTTLVLVRRARGATDASHAAAIAAAVEASGREASRVLATGLDAPAPGVERAEAALQAALDEGASRPSA